MNHLFYKAVFDHPNLGVVLTWHESSGEASRSELHVMGVGPLRPSQVMEALVPTDKPALLKWLNDNCTVEV